MWQSATTAAMETEATAIGIFRLDEKRHGRSDHSDRTNHGPAGGDLLCSVLDGRHDFHVRRSSQARVCDRGQYRAPMWVLDPGVQTVANTIGMPDYVLDAVRSIKGVNYAVPLYSGGALVKLSDGTYQSVRILGLDDTTLFGRPQPIQGNIQDIYGESAFVVLNDAEFQNSKIRR